MKKYAIAVMALALSAVLFTGCGCQNTNMEPTATIAPSTQATHAPTTQATTVPTTEASLPSSVPSEGMTDNTTGTAGADGFVEENPTGTTGTGNAADNSRARSRTHVNDSTK